MKFFRKRQYLLFGVLIIVDVYNMCINRNLFQFKNL